MKQFIRGPSTKHYVWYWHIPEVNKALYITSFSYLFYRTKKIQSLNCTLLVQIWIKYIIYNSSKYVVLYVVHFIVRTSVWNIFSCRAFCVWYPNKKTYTQIHSDTHTHCWHNRACLHIHYYSSINILTCNTITILSLPVPRLKCDFYVCSETLHK